VHDNGENVHKVHANLSAKCLFCRRIVCQRNVCTPFRVAWQHML